MVFQASKKATKPKSESVNFKELEMVKNAEAKSVRDIENANKQAERLLVDTEKRLIAAEDKAIADLTRKLEFKFKKENEAAIKQSEQIRAEGKTEAKKLKEEVMARKPEAIRFIIKVISGV